MATGTKRLAGAEDLLLGSGTISQERDGNTYVITKINSSVIPFTGDETTGDLVTLKDILDQILASSGVDVVTEW